MKQWLTTRLQDIPIGRKLTIVIVTINIIVLLSSTLIQMGFIFYNERNFLQTRLLLTADVVAYQMIASLEFADPVSANQILSSLRVYPSVDSACIYDINGKVFSSFVLHLLKENSNNNSAVCPSLPKTLPKFEWKYLKLFADITSERKKIGTLYLEYNLRPLYESMSRVLFFNLVITACAFLLSYFISSYLQQLILEPVRSLANITRKFARTHDYSLRARKYAGDELGELVDDFNMMVEELEKHEARFKKVIEELSDTNVELERFAYICSHDLQEPLRMVSNYTQLLAKQYQDVLSGDALEYMEFIIDGAVRMRELINDILSYSRIGYAPGPIASVNIQEVVDNVLKNLALVIKEKNALITSDPLPVILGYGVLIMQIFQNLLSNALKFSKNKQAKVHIGVRRITGAWEFSVQDNGIGISPQYHEKIFEIFKRLNRREEYEGTGIGLSICKKAVEYHGGHIWISSVLGQGCTFFFTIPDYNPDIVLTNKKGETNI